MTIDKRLDLKDKLNIIREVMEKEEVSIKLPCIYEIDDAGCRSFYGVNSSDNFILNIMSVERVFSRCSCTIFFLKK